MCNRSALSRRSVYLNVIERGSFGLGRLSQACLTQQSNNTLFAGAVAQPGETIDVTLREFAQGRQTSR
jgi:hypothetical protein